MKISNINTLVNFGKTAVATCTVTDKASENNVPATLYLMDPRNENDYKEIIRSKNTNCIKNSATRDRSEISRVRNKEFYLLKANSNDEVIACAETQHRFRAGEGRQHSGLTTLVEEISENSKFKNGALSLLGYITQRADNRYDNSVTALVGEEESTSIQKHLKGVETTGLYALPKEEFTSFINIAKENTGLEFIV